MIKVLIVEDDTVTRESLTTYIEHHPGLSLAIAVDNAEAGIDALRLLPDRPDIILLDIGLPGMSGLEAIPSIKKVDPALDIIMFTTYEEEEKIFAALCAGACSYISKRTPLKTIMESIKTVHAGGSYMSPSIARKIANHFKPEQKPISTDQITDRQMEIIVCLVDGLSYKMIADKLNISIDTVRSHIKKIYKALQVNSSLEVVKKYTAGEL